MSSAWLGLEEDENLDFELHVLYCASLSGILVQCAPSEIQCSQRESTANVVLFQKV